MNILKKSYLTNIFLYAHHLLLTSYFLLLAPVINERKNTYYSKL